MERGRTGKTTDMRFLYGNALKNGRSVTVVDADRVNATLASFVRDARRPTAGDDVTCAKVLEDTIAEAIDLGGDFLIDVGGGDRLFLDLSERHELPKLLREHNVQLVLRHYAAGGRDDFEALRKCVASGLTSDRTIILLNEGLAGAHPSGQDPFESLLNGGVVKNCIEHGARVVRIPAVPLATMVMADALYISIQEAALGKVPSDELGNPIPEATPLGLFRRLELTRWLNTLTQRYEDAGVKDWLP